MLWSHYGDQHKGLCIGYKLDRDPPPTPQRVLYGGDRHISTSSLFLAFVAGDEPEAKALDRNVLLRKARCWSYEREWRLVGPQGLQESPMLMSEVIFGLRCPLSVQHAVVQALERRSSPVRFFAIHEVRGKFALRKGNLDVHEIRSYLPHTAESGNEMFPATDSP